MIYLSLFINFFKCGLFSFGGGYGMLPLMEDTFVKNGWITESQFFEFVGVCESTPGPIAVNMATYIGSTMGGLFGSICATLGVVLPSFIIIVIIAAILKNLTENKLFKGFVKGVGPVVSALIVSTGALLLIKCLGYNSINSFNFNGESIIIIGAVTAFFFLFKLLGKKLTAIPTVIISALLGLIIGILKQ